MSPRYPRPSTAAPELQLIERLRAGEHRAGKNPKSSGQVTHLRGKHRTNQWTRACNRREVMAKEDVSIGGNVIEAVIVTVGGRRPRRIDAEHLVRHEQRVEAVGEEVDAKGGNNEPSRADALAPAQGYNSQGNRT